MHDGFTHLSEFTLHVVLATFPQTQERDFDISVKEEFYKKYRENCPQYFTEKDKSYWYYNGKTDTPVIYSPLSYHILGNYDVAYITLIDSFKFAQRLFEPQSSDTHKKKIKLFAPHTFQSFTGITHHEDPKDLKRFFYDHLKPNKPIRKFFLGICNVKLNNGFLIGNGKKYLNVVLKLINETIQKEMGVDHLILQSFSWFEISLIIFADDPQQIANIIQNLRRLTIKELLKECPDILDESLYKSLYRNKGQSFFENANVFADTHSYVGIHADVFKEDKIEYQLAFEKAASKFEIKTEVEWQIKPGHMHLLAKLLAKKKILKNYPIKKEDKRFLAGRTDYCLERDLMSLTDIVKLIRLIMNDKTFKLFEHVRKIKTKLYFVGLAEATHPSKRIINLHKKLMVLAEDMETVAKVNKQLKAMKLSRQIRSKVLKIFSNYNNGIQDIVLFSYQLDFKIFIERLKSMIDVAHNKFESRFINPLNYKSRPEVDKLEDILMKMIDIFQEGFNIRMLNPYQFEDINDFDLDFNSSIQQLLSVYSSIAFEIGNLIYAPDYSFGPVIQLNLKDTVSNDSSINYYVNHLTSPEFIFATLTKEILNNLTKDDKNLERLIQYYYDKKQLLLDVDAVIRDLDKRDLININYFFNDAFRFIWTYNMEFDVFYYWFWTYNFQNPSLYSEMGLMDENHFEKELFRILFIAKFFGQDKTSNVICPLPELQTYWERHFDKIEIAVSTFIKFLFDIGLAKRFTDYLEGRLVILMKRSEKGLNLINKDSKGAALLVANIETKYSPTGVLNFDISNLFKNRYYIFNQLDKQPEELKENSILYLEWYMWKYLKTIYKKNDGKFSLVRRNWVTGEPMKSFVEKNDSAQLYAVDQTGGLFFENISQQNEYFKQTSQVLMDLWHYSLIRKKEFIKKKTPAPKK
jgi:hypothetical protein